MDTKKERLDLLALIEEAVAMKINELEEWDDNHAPSLVGVAIREDGKMFNYQLIITAFDFEEDE